MDAKIYQLDSIRSQRQSRMLMDAFFPKSMVSDGLALMINASLFLVEYWGVMASSHVKIVSACFSEGSRLQKGTAPK